MVLSLQQSRICRLRLAYLPTREEIRKKPVGRLHVLLSCVLLLEFGFNGLINKNS